VKFYTAVNLAAELAEAVQMNRLSRLEKSLSKIDLLIIDELSYLTVTANQSPEPTQPTQYDIITLKDNTQAERSNEHGKNI
jgi:hypothetical protein